MKTYEGNCKYFMFNGSAFQGIQKFNLISWGKFVTTLHGSVAHMEQPFRKKHHISPPLKQKLKLFLLLY